MFACVIVALFGLSACGDVQDISNSGPKVDSLSNNTVVIGQTLEFFGNDFLDGEEGESHLYFEGTFTDAFGRSIEVSTTIVPIFGGREIGDDGRDILTWSRVGPYRNPFTRDERNGLFRGTVQVVNSYSDGSEEVGEHVALSLEIAPSIMIESFQPIHAKCGAPAVRIFPGVPYALKVKVSGIRPNRFVYEFNNINGSSDVSSFVHSFSEDQVATEDSVGTSSEIVVFNQIPEDQQSYITAVRILAYDAEGNYVETALPVGVHRPFEVSYDGSFELAERYEPVPVSGCIPGAVGSNVTYSESTTETRTQSVTMTVNNSWSSTSGRDVSQNTTEGISIGESSSRSIRNSTSERENLSESFGESYQESTANQVGFSSTDGESWSWNLSQGQSEEEYQSNVNNVYGEASGSVKVGVEGEGSVPGFAKVAGSVDTTVGVMAGTSTGTGGGNRQRTSTNRGYSMSGSSSESNTFGNSINESQTTSISGTYMLGRNSSSSESNNDTTNTAHAWDISEGISVNESAGMSLSESISKAIVSSESKTVSRGFSGFIPRGRFGIFYRQTTRWIRRAEVISYDLCGIANHMGELQFNEWDWAPDLAIGESCDELPPPSSMPVARCLISPCGK
jgi:hypothetical protein